MNNINVKEMVIRFIELEKMENEYGTNGLLEKAQEANTAKWSIDKDASYLGVYNEFNKLLKELRKGAQ